MVDSIKNKINSILLEDAANPSLDNIKNNIQNIVGKFFQSSDFHNILKMFIGGDGAPKVSNKILNSIKSAMNFVMNKFKNIIFKNKQDVSEGVEDIFGRLGAVGSIAIKIYNAFKTFFKTNFEMPVEPLENPHNVGGDYYEDDYKDRMQKHMEEWSATLNQRGIGWIARAIGISVAIITMASVPSGFVALIQTLAIMLITLMSIYILFLFFSHIADQYVPDLPEEENLFKLLVKRFDQLGKDLIK